MGSERILRKYGVEAVIPFALWEADGVDFKTDATFAAGNVKIMSDEGSEVNTDNLPVDAGTGYHITLTAPEMEASRIVLYFIDSATKEYLDISINIETYDTLGSGEHTIGDAIETKQDTVISAIGTPPNLGGGADLASNNSDLAGTAFNAATDSQENIKDTQLQLDSLADTVTVEDILSKLLAIIDGNIVKTTPVTGTDRVTIKARDGSTDAVITDNTEDSRTRIL